MADSVGDIIGDYRAFAAQKRDRLLARGIDIRPYPLSHLAVRVPEWDQYVHLRTLLERHATANDESVWNGRPISKIVLATPSRSSAGRSSPSSSSSLRSISASTGWASSTSEWSSARTSMCSRGTTAPR